MPTNSHNQNNNRSINYYELYLKFKRKYLNQKNIMQAMGNFQNTITNDDNDMFSDTSEDESVE